MNLLVPGGKAQRPPDKTQGLQGWEPVTPRDALRPRFSAEGDRLAISGDGNAYEFGYWRREVPVTGGGAYRLQVRFRVTGEVDVTLNVLNMVLWTDGGTERRRCPHDHVSHLWRSNGMVCGEGSFSVPSEATAAEVQVGLRFAPRGTVEWDSVELTPCEPADPRPVRVTAVRWHGEPRASLDENRKALAQLVDQAASQASDLVLLPEYAVHSESEITGFEASEPVPDGPSCEVFAHKAKEHEMNICANLIERDGSLLFNTAVLFDRQGNLVGRYRKVHPYWPEEIWGGVTPGDDLPVFSLDVGTVGIMTCYDSWFPEVSRLLALRGAELILFPSAGYEPSLLPARAIDNRCYVVASSLDSPAMIIDTLGHVLAATRDGMVTVPVDLARRPTPHANSGGTLNSSPGGRRSLRHALSWALYEDLLSEARTWDGREDGGFVWERTGAGRRKDELNEVLG
jgi:predicted amidohydrolase